MLKSVVYFLEAVLVVSLLAVAQRLGYTLQPAVLALQVLLVIFAHELGRLLVAKWRGLWVERLTVGFGPPLFSARKGTIEWDFRLFPVGVFVSLPQLVQPDTGNRNRQDNQNTQDRAAAPLSLRDKLLVSCAGPVSALVVAAGCAAVSRFFLVCVETVILFNFLILAHEYGHFLFARRRGLRVDRFAIWFGTPIMKTQFRGVEYALGFIPAGGYVSLPQMATMEAIEGKSENAGQPLPPISALDKIIVAFAGPLFSFLLALIFAVVVMGVGRPVSETETTTVIGYVEKDSPAEKVGLAPGDRILEVDHEPVSKFGGMGDSVTWRIVRSTGSTVHLKVQRDGKTLDFYPTPVKDETKFWQRKSLRQIKIAPAQTALIAEVLPHGPAAAAGLKAGDRVLSLNGVQLQHFYPVSDQVENHPQESFTLLVERNGRRFEVRVTPEKPVSPPEAKPRIGLAWDANGLTRLVHPGAIEQVHASVMAMVETFGALFSRHTDIKPQHLGGAVKIMDVYYRLFNSEQGWRLALWFSVLMNVNLAVLNMLPIPVLDGGHILLALIEAIRRKPLSIRIIHAVQTGCAVLLIGFMVYIAFYDVQDLPWKRSKEKPAPVKFAPKAPRAN